jgi:hypothetical protein
MESGYDFEKLAREIAAGRLKPLGDNVGPGAAEVARETLVASLKSTAQKQDPRLTVAAVCRGILGGLLLNGQPLAPAAVAIMKELGNVSHDVPVTPEDLMTWAMEGFAQIAVVSGPEASQTMETAIEESFMGAGSVFAEACGAARKKGSA